jgi:hypothetical protein
VGALTQDETNAKQGFVNKIIDNIIAARQDEA